MLIINSATLLAQRFTVQGTVVDSVGAPLPSATVMLMNPRDSSLVNFAVTGIAGKFEIKAVEKGEYDVRISFVGFAPFSKRIGINDFTSAKVDLGILHMVPLSKELDEVIVTAEKAPVTVKRDTIEFNAGSFKTQANANVEDLLKKMPGIEVQTDGSIRAQGEQVQRVMVDGREFFGRDPKLATRNLPADAVEKVQVFDKKSDQAVFTGIDDGQREKTINLELKEEKRKGAFGTLMAGAGNEQRWQGRGSVNKFSKAQQLSFLGMANNINDQGFSIDDYMNFSGGMRQLAGGGNVRVEFSSDNDNGVPLNFGGRQNGVVTNYAGGINLNRDFSDKTKLTSSYFYNRLDQDVIQNTERINYLPNGTFNFDEDSRQSNVSDNHRINLALDHVLDSANTIRFTTNATYTGLSQTQQSQSATVNAEGLLQNKSERATATDASNANLNSSLLFRHRFPKKGRSLTTTLTLGVSDNTSEGDLIAANEFYRPDGVVLNDIHQINSQDTETQTYGASVSYTEPLGNRRYLEANYSYRGNLNSVNREVFNVESSQLIPDEDLSNQYKSNYQYNRPGLNFRMNRPKYNVTVGASYQVTTLYGELITQQATINRSFNNVLPAARFNYDFSSFKRLRFDYETSVQEPGIQQLQPVINNTDPLNISVGNPDLQPAYRHGINLNYTQFDPGRFIGFFAFANAAYTRNAIAYSQAVDQDFVRVTQPVNVDYSFNSSANVNLSFPVKRLNSRFSLGPSVTYNRNVNLLNGQENTANQYTAGGTFRYDYTLKDFLTVGLSANVSEQQTRYRFDEVQDQQFLNETYTAETNLNFWKHYAFNTNFQFFRYQSLTTGFEQSIPLLNLSVSRFILKAKSGEIKLGVVNLLDRSLSITQTANVNYLQQVTTNNLGRYFMLSFTYALNRQLNPTGPRPGGGGMRMIMRN